MTWFLLGFLIATGSLNAKKAPAVSTNPPLEPLLLTQGARQTTVMVEEDEFTPSAPPGNAEEEPAEQDSLDEIPEFADFHESIDGLEKLDGLFTLYRRKKTNELLLEIRPEQLDRDYLWSSSLTRGIGEWMFLRGMPIDDYGFQFRRINNEVQLVVPNNNFRLDPTSPLQKSLDRSFSDSPVASVPIISINEDNEHLLVDISYLMGSGMELGKLAAGLWFEDTGTSYGYGTPMSRFESVKAFSQNLEIETVTDFVGGGLIPSESSARPESFSLGVNVSIAEMRSHPNYQPRVADERMGYFVEAYKDLDPNITQGDGFVRYIKRWYLEPKDLSVPISDPIQPITFWLDNAIPERYRPAVKEGVEAWNRAFEQAGFSNAIEVKQMPDDADWDPADMRYNTIIWSGTYGSGLLGLGPSRSNPITGEILDADILINANVVDFMRDEYDNLINLGNDDAIKNLGQLCQNAGQLPWTLPSSSAQQPQIKPLDHPQLYSLITEYDGCYGMGASQELELGLMAMELLGPDMVTNADRDRYFHQFLVSLIAHEVGHTLGLRHNFHGSTLLSPAELNDKTLTDEQGLVSSLMDYPAVNLAPHGETQGDYFTTQIGAHDYWTIEYGYRYFPSLMEEKQALKEIASRAHEPELAYATDEDLMIFRDPFVNAYDLSSDVLGYSQIQLDNAQVMWDKLSIYAQGRYEPGDLRTKFDGVLFHYLKQLQLTMKYIGGREFERVAKNSPSSVIPFKTVSVEEQRRALAILENYVFAEDAFNFSPELINSLAPDRWRHWGVSFFDLYDPDADYPLYGRITWLQNWVLENLLSPYTLNNLKDLELKTPPSELLAMPELFASLDQAIWSEILEPKNLKIYKLRIYAVLSSDRI
ncbi:MAG: zinc-dependent metalloprotease [Synechococcaceae cyanobacterium RL_1_2]|nr:zinc-dependent metalloprotease [Synechococcaceae cyanobacterium RL_1_2]